MKKKLLLGVWFVLVTAHVLAQPALPKDVEQFVAKREGCDHFRGEIPDPDQKQRMREVNRELKSLCTGTDNALARLKAKYANNAVVMQTLGEFEPQIEPSNTRQPKKSVTR
jgi:hypothetical protein